jgi:hypothetical protein
MSAIALPQADPWTTRRIQIFAFDGTFRTGTPQSLFGEFSGGDWKRVLALHAHMRRELGSQPWAERAFKAVELLHDQAQDGNREASATYDVAAPMLEIRLENVLRQHYSSPLLFQASEAPAAPPPPPPPAPVVIPRPAATPEKLREISGLLRSLIWKGVQFRIDPTSDGVYYFDFHRSISPEQRALLQDYHGEVRRILQEGHNMTAPALLHGGRELVPTYPEVPQPARVEAGEVADVQESAAERLAAQAAPVEAEVQAQVEQVEPTAKQPTKSKRARAHAT